MLFWALRSVHRRPMCRSPTKNFKKEKRTKLVPNFSRLEFVFCQLHCKLRKAQKNITHNENLYHLPKWSPLKSHKRPWLQSTPKQVAYRCQLTTWRKNISNIKWLASQALGRRFVESCRNRLIQVWTWALMCVITFTQNWTSFTHNFLLPFINKLPKGLVNYFTVNKVP